VKNKNLTEVEKNQHKQLLPRGLSSTISGFEVLNKIVKGELVSSSKNVIHILSTPQYKPPYQ